MHITRVPIITFTDMKQSCSANEHHMFCFSLDLFVCLLLKTALFGLKQVLSNVYAITNNRKEDLINGGYSDTRNQWGHYEFGAI
jgi:hypothetical protein